MNQDILNTITGITVAVAAINLIIAHWDMWYIEPKMIDSRWGIPKGHPWGNRPKLRIFSYVWLATSWIITPWIAFAVHTIWIANINAIQDRSAPTIVLPAKPITVQAPTTLEAK